MLELLFVIGFFVMLMVTGVSLLGIIAALVVATAIMFLGGMLALMIKLLRWCGLLRRLKHQKCRNISVMTAGVTKGLCG